MRDDLTPEQQQAVFAGRLITANVIAAQGAALAGDTVTAAAYVNNPYSGVTAANLTPEALAAEKYRIEHPTGFALNFFKDIVVPAIAVFGGGYLAVAGVAAAGAAGTVEAGALGATETAAVGSSVVASEGAAVYGGLDAAAITAASESGALVEAGTIGAGLGAPAVAETVSASGATMPAAVAETPSQLASWGLTETAPGSGVFVPPASSSLVSPALADVIAKGKALVTGLLNGNASHAPTVASVAQPAGQGGSLLPILLLLGLAVAAR